MAVTGLFSSCAGEPIKGKPSKPVCESACTHALTALVLSIVLGAGAALAAYYFTQGVILWTAVAGGSALVVGGLSTYSILRCSCGKKEEPSRGPQILSSSLPNLNQEPPSSEIPKPFLSSALPPPPVPRHLSPPKSPEDPSKPSSSAPSHKPPATPGPAASTAVPKTRPVPAGPLPIPKAPFDDTPAYTGKLDPYSQLPMETWLSATRELSANVKRQYGDIGRFVKQLESDKDLQGKDLILRSIAICFSQGLVVSFLGQFTPEAANLKMKLNATNLSKQVNVQRQGLNTQLDTLLPGRTRYFGVTNPLDPGSFFQAAAQLISGVMQKPVTEKELRDQCAKFMRENQVAIEKECKIGNYPVAIVATQITTKDRAGIPGRGAFELHGRILAQLYHIDLVLVTAPEPDDVDAGYEVELPEPKHAKPFFDAQPPTAQCIMTLVGNHFFPVFVSE